MLNMKDAMRVHGLEIIRIINDSLGAGNKGRRLIGEMYKSSLSVCTAEGR